MHSAEGLGITHAYYGKIKQKVVSRMWFANDIDLTTSLSSLILGIALALLFVCMFNKKIDILILGHVCVCSISHPFSLAMHITLPRAKTAML